MNRKEAIKFVAVRSLGNFLLLFAVYGVVATFGPVIAAEAQYRIIQIRGIQFQVREETKETKATKENDTKYPSGSSVSSVSSGTSRSGFAQILVGSKQQILIPKDTDFSISIPKIGASSKIYPNVDPTNSSEFLPILQKGVAHAKGTVFPGMSGNVYLFAHSTDNWWNVGRYNAVFYLLSHLTTGDEIVVFFEGKRYEYAVSQTVISNPEDTTLLTQAQGGEERLVLQTCWPPGTTWKRLYVLAKPKQ